MVCPHLIGIVCDKRKEGTKTEVKLIAYTVRMPKQPWEVETSSSDESGSESDESDTECDTDDVARVYAVVRALNGALRRIAAAEQDKETVAEGVTMWLQMNRLDETILPLLNAGMQAKQRLCCSGESE